MSEKQCNLGELSQFIINTRNTQGQDSPWSDENCPVLGPDQIGFCSHKRLEFLLHFCSRCFIRPFPVPLLKAILSFFRTSIILVISFPFPDVQSSFNCVSKCLYSVVITQPELADIIASFFCQSWPWRDSSRELLYLRQIECTFLIIPQDAQRKFFSLLFPRLRKSMVSTNRFVSLQSIQFIMCVIQNYLSVLSSAVGLIACDDDQMVTSLSEVLTSLQNHWCEKIREKANICLKTLLVRVELRSSSEEDEMRGRSEAFTS